ncbi:alpha-D-xyloside xylohydrolase [Pelomonas saccharophila]|uniref:Alpha-D-xyloside xylohydrolase n=1 Tax=Roseateles saccharophilus TaxID=304 RepID=A0ABU1YFA5_ROSSA|nr:TIM-barrel domain-containing protein [Roseateles saccharophilus]MDR7267418.1 alpha-D-xyloside xylohydrolase [Roseateles saccharophilus]
MNDTSFSRRQTLQAALAGVATPLLAATATDASASGFIPADAARWVLTLPQGDVEIGALSHRALRIRFLPPRGATQPSPASLMLLPGLDQPLMKIRFGEDTGEFELADIRCVFHRETGTLKFFDRNGTLLLSEAPGSRRLTPSRLDDEPVFIAEQAFKSPAGERLYGTGCFQDGAMDLRGLPRRLTQVNTQISLPFMLSSRGYGLLWHNNGMAELNPPEERVVLDRMGTDGKVEYVDVTTTTGNARVERKGVRFEGRFHTEMSGRHAFLLDVGRSMASRHSVTIDGKPCVEMTNLWLPPTSGFVVELPAGEHHVVIEADEKDAPSLHFGPALARTTWRSPVAEAIDYVVIAGPSADEVLEGYREVTGATPMMPRWAYGYIHCRERFHSSEEIVDTLREFRRRKLPVDVMVQDWQYWGHHGWNAMRFDEAHYPDPASLVRDVHSLNARLMLSVWAKVDRKSELGRAAAAARHYIGKTDWIDFFDPKSAAFYWENQRERLLKLGIDAWWQDATEPENDDLVGRRTAAGRGERVRLAYPFHVTRTVYEGQRQALPDQRVMILTRSAFPGQQRHAAATWSGDIGNDWDTLKRQIPAGLNMAAAGYAYWTVDAGGFFRPGDGQYTDKAYHERFLRWFQYATFLPLQRVHGYMTDTEFWRYGDKVEAVSRQYLELRYRLLPYLYSVAHEVHAKGAPIMRPLVFDFPDDPQALDQAHSYLFGRALHVAPVLAPDVSSWPVYLPQSAGGWVDFWTGERRAGGRTHDVPSPLERIPLHLRAGSILPLGPVLQSTTDATGEVIDLYVVPGRDGAFDLYEDDGLDYAYEKGGFSVIRLSWDDKRGVLRLAARRGRFDGMLKTRRFRLHRVGPGQPPLQSAPLQELVYTGRMTEVRLA